MKRLVFLAPFLLALPLGRASAAPADWTRSFPPFRIAGNLYYIGSEELARISHRG